MFDTIPGASIPDLLATHQRLLDLPVSRVFPGHFEVFDGRRLRKLIEAYRREKSA